MPSGNVIILTKTTAAISSKSFSLTQISRQQSVTIIANGLTGTNKAYLQILDPSNNNWNNLLLNGNPIYFDANNSVIFLAAEGVYRINKLGSDNIGITVQSSLPINIFD